MVKIPKNLEFLLKPRNMAFIASIGLASLPNLSFGNVQERVQRGFEALSQLDKSGATEEQIAEYATDAENIFARVLKEEPSNCKALVGYGKLQMKVGDFGRAVSSLEKAASECENDEALEALTSAYMNIGDFVKAKENINVLLQRNKNSANAHGQLGFIHWANKDYCSAIDEYEKVIASEPRWYWIFNNMAAAYKELGDFDNALKYAVHAVEINPNYAEGHFEIGIIKKEIGDKEGSLKELRKAVELAPRAENFRKELDSAEASSNK